MKKLQLIFAGLGLVIMFNACAPSEEVQPQDGEQKLEKFDVKNSDNAPTIPGKK